jgi:hypothetical protein
MSKINKKTPPLPLILPRPLTLSPLSQNFIFFLSSTLLGIIPQAQIIKLSPSTLTLELWRGHFQALEHQKGIKVRHASSHSLFCGLSSILGKWNFDLHLPHAIS